MHKLLDSGAGPATVFGAFRPPLILKFISMIGYKFPSVRKAAV